MNFTKSPYMKKYLLLMLALLMAMSASASGDLANPTGTAQEEAVNQFIEKLDNVNGYVFIGRGEKRDLRHIVNRADNKNIDLTESQIMDYDLTLSNTSIADITAEGVITGRSYGEVFLTVHNPKDGDNTANDQYFAIFVCPTVTVVSPEGIVYKYQKTYNQPARIKLTKGNDFQLNCVMMLDEKTGEWTDITDNVARGAAAGDDIAVNIEDGVFQSKHPILNDITFVISEETADGDEHVGASGVNVQVRGFDVYFKYAQTGEPIVNECINVYDINKVYLWDATTDSEGRIHLDVDNVFYLEMTNTEIFPGEFKVFTHNLNSYK